MKQNKTFIGIDVSKSTLDICIIEGSCITSVQISNNTKSITRFLKPYMTREGLLYLGLENTGYYNWNIYKVVDGLDISVFIIPPLHLKRSLGLTRGKSDKVDAQRIAQYVQLRHDQLTPSILPTPLIRKVQVLIAQRTRLVKARTQLLTAHKEACEHIDKREVQLLERVNTAVVQEFNESIKQIEARIEELIGSDQELHANYQYMTSVQGVGKVLAWTLLIKTNEFRQLTDPRKLACYAGVVPFTHQSGTSIHKRPRVSLMADKELKKLLHLAAMRAIQLPGDLKDYYQRKVAEGKNKMSVLNAVRNKIIARICAVIKNKRIYTPAYQNNLVVS